MWVCGNMFPYFNNSFTGVVCMLELHGNPESRLLNSINGVTLSFHFFLKITHSLFISGAAGRGCSSFGDRSLTGRSSCLRSPGSVSYSAWAQWWGYAGSDFSVAYGIITTGAGIKPMSPTLADEFSLRHQGGPGHLAFVPPRHIHP